MTATRAARRKQPLVAKAAASTNGAKPMPAATDNDKALYKAPAGGVKATSINLVSPTPMTYLTLITPEVAEAWLGRNSHNRDLRNGQVSYLEGVIERGEWVLNGDAIRWSKAGILSDGQHRLWAIVNTGIAVPSAVATGLDDAAQDTIDLGARRNLKDALKLAGVPDAVSLAGVISYFWRYQNGHVRYGNIKPSIGQGQAVYAAHPELRDAALDAKNQFVKRFRGTSVAMIATALYEIRSIDSDDADAFWQGVVTGENLNAHDPRFLLRKHFEQQTASAGLSNGSGARATALVSHALFNKAWNFWRDGREIDRLSWKAAGLKAEPFPEPH